MKNEEKTSSLETKEERYRHVKATPSFAALDVIDRQLTRGLFRLQKGKGHTTLQLI